MVSDISAPVVNEVNVVAEKRVRRSSHNKKSPGKIPKKIHKAEREKLKRDHLNELFLELGNALDPSRQNNGKASILSDATRILRDLLTQVQCLKRENVALQSESHYVSVEKKELRDENAVLEAEIEKLQTQIHERAPSEPAWNTAPAKLQQTGTAPSLPEDHLPLSVAEPPLQSPPVVGPLFVIPLHHDFKAYSESGTTQAPPKTPSNVSRPHARYPTPDSWPSQLLAKQLEKQEKQLSCSSTVTSREEQGSVSV